MEKILTIVVPTYNMQDYLRRCLDSLLVPKEQLSQMEVLVINDGSKDNSSAIAHEYQDKYPETFRVIDKENGNYGSCVNRGLKEASGRYIRICDSDDCYYTENLSAFVNLLSGIDSDMVFSPFDIMDFQSRLVTLFVPCDLPEGDLFDINEINWSDKIMRKYRAMHCITVKTELLKQNNYHQTEGISYTDTEFVFYSILYSGTCIFFNRPVYKYYLGRDGQTMSHASMVKSHMHFYENAKVMMDTYITLPNTISKNKQYLLYSCIDSCLYYFTIVTIRYIEHPEEQIKLLTQFLEAADNCSLYCPLSKLLMRDKAFLLWHRFHVPICVLRLLDQIKHNPFKTRS